MSIWGLILAISVCYEGVLAKKFNSIGVLGAFTELNLEMVIIPYISKKFFYFFLF